jgi:plastocyanin
LFGLGTGLAAAAGVGIGQVAGQSHDVTVSLNNVGTSAWEVTEVTGDEDVAPTGEENPTLTLQVGTRYLFENGGWSSHPLAFRDANGDPLLTQSGTGSFEDDADVNWVDDDQTVAFTLTESLASELDDYICTVHSSMNGSVATEQQPAAAVTFTEQTTGGGSVFVDSVRMDEGGFVTMHDDSLLDGDALGSVVGVSEYLGPGSYEDVVVGLDSELTSDQTLIAMPHRDTDGDETYDFVDTDGSEDGPYTDAGSAITDSGQVTVASALASVTFADQTTDGTSVTVDSVRMDRGGFVTMHDDSLLDGDTLGSVVGVSEYLGPGSYEDVVVSLDEELTSDQTLIAMPHRDTNDNETYDFVDTDGSEDGPFTNNDGAITDSGQVTITSAAVTFSDQTSDGTSVTVDSVRMDEGGFVTMHDDSLLDGDALGSVVGVSEYLGPGSHEDVTVDLDEDLSETQTLIAMPHRDTDGDETYDFVDTDGSDDGPYTDAGSAITDSAEVSVDTGSDDGISASAPGFGVATGIAGLGGLAAYAYRKLNLDQEPPTPAEDGLDDGAE